MGSLKRALILTLASTAIVGCTPEPEQAVIEQEQQKPWAIGTDWEKTARHCMSDLPDRLEGCKELYANHSTSVGDCYGYAFYELRSPQHEIDQRAAKRAEAGCQTDLEILPYDGKTVHRLDGRLLLLEEELGNATANRKDAIDEIEIERLRAQIAAVKAERTRIIDQR